VWTYGYGHTKGVKEGDEIDTATAEKLLLGDLQEAEGQVKRRVSVELAPDMVDALVDFQFNTGAFGASTLRRLLNRADYEGAAGQFSRWVYGGGRKLPGLVLRRHAEEMMFRRGIDGLL